MYNDFYHFNEDPFSITADPDFFFSSSQHDEAISHLQYGIRQRKGIIVVTGEIGTGKTTLCRTLLDRIDSNIKSAIILNPSFSDTQLLKLIVKDFGIEGKYRNKYDLVEALNTFLIKETREGNNVVLIIDESQNLGLKQLEQIRLLSNLETEKQKLLQIVLVGQPELLEKLKNQSLRQLNQRVAVRYHITPLKRDELNNYISHRVQIAQQRDEKNELNFTEGALDAIFKISSGTPRMINILCDRALLAGFVAETKNIDENIVVQCSREVVQV